jgi:hypothetical protein
MEYFTHTHNLEHTIFAGMDGVKNIDCANNAIPPFNRYIAGT